jgi:hypothetical protein
MLYYEYNSQVVNTGMNTEQFSIKLNFQIFDS